MEKKSLQEQILSWYTSNKRNLPWRKTHDPYKILVSEVMLQQTQVDRVVPKYKAFLKQFPSVRALAHAKTSDVLKAWAGLGYNRRALYLQKTAQAVMEKYGGKFPKDLSLLKALPGIGDYTARAILSFAFLEPVPMMDTNHRKFYQRVFFGKQIVDDATLLRRAERLIDRFCVPDRRGSRGRDVAYNVSTRTMIYDWNQALMDFMTAVARSSDDPTVTWFRERYPVANKKTRKQENKKVAVKFLDTDRYFRGRIIDLLREKEKTTVGALHKKFSRIPKERVETIVKKLEKDGLILIREKSIVLP